jgi:phage terminase small subunit
MSNTVYSTQIQKLKVIDVSISSLSSRVKELKSKAEETWFIDPKGLDFNGALNHFQKEINSNTEEFENIAQETNMLLEKFSIENKDETNLKEINVRLIASGKLLESRIEDFKRVVEDNMWVIVSNIMTEIINSVKGFVKTTLVGFKFAVKGLISGYKTTFRLTGFK